MIKIRRRAIFAATRAMTSPFFTVYSVLPGADNARAEDTQIDFAGE